MRHRTSEVACLETSFQTRDGRCDSRSQRPSRTNSTDAALSRTAPHGLAVTARPVVCHHPLRKRHPAEVEAFVYATTTLGTVPACHGKAMYANALSLHDAPSTLSCAPDVLHPIIDHFYRRAPPHGGSVFPCPPPASFMACRPSTPVPTAITACQTTSPTSSQSGRPCRRPRPRAATPTSACFPSICVFPVGRDRQPFAD